MQDCIIHTRNGREHCSEKDMLVHAYVMMASVKQLKTNQGMHFSFLSCGSIYDTESASKSLQQSKFESRGGAKQTVQLGPKQQLTLTAQRETERKWGRQHRQQFGAPSQQLSAFTYPRNHPHPECHLPARFQSTWIQRE